MRQVVSTRARRPVVVALCIVIRLGRRLRTSCDPVARRVARIAVHAVAYDGECTTLLTAHVVVAAAARAALGMGAAFAGLGPSQLCKIAGALVVGALAVSAASVLIRGQLGASGTRHAMRPLLAGAARQVSSEPLQHPAAQILRGVYGGHRSTAVTTLDVAVAVLAPALPAVPSLEATGAELLRFALTPAKRLVPVVNLALDAHDVYRHSRESARFVRQFALTAASLCPAPRAPALLVA